LSLTLLVAMLLVADAAYPRKSQSRAPARPPGARCAPHQWFQQRRSGPFRIVRL